MKIIKILFRWWLEGWKLFFHYAAFYILLVLFLIAPAALLGYFYNFIELSPALQIITSMLYFGIYFPLVFKGSATYLGK